MARSKKKNKTLRKILTALIIVAVCASVFITLGEQGLLPFETPSWNDIYGQAELVPVAEGAPMSVHYIDVGQGDCILVVTQEGTMLIDAGDRTCGEDVVRYIESQGIDNLDIVVTTHNHADHIGGMAQVIDSLTVGEVYVPLIGTPPTSKTYSNLIDTIQQRQVSMITTTGTQLSLGTVKVTVLSSSITNDENNASLVVRLDCGEVSFLFTGDLEAKGEQAVLATRANLDVDIYKVGHHGSKTSSSEGFLQAITPQTSVISVGAGNSYGHPHPEVVERLQGYGDVYRTDISATVVITTDGTTYEVKTAA